MLNQTTLMGELVGKFKLPYKNICAIEIKLAKTEYVIHMSEKMWEQIPMNEGVWIAVKGHLYHLEGQLNIMADKITMIGN